MVSAVLIANGDADVGGGHISRCLTLGRALQSKGVNARLIVKPEAMDLINGFTLDGITVQPTPFEEITLRAQTEHADIVTIDNYGWSAEMERRITPDRAKLLIIDDLANRQHDCDVLLDQNFGRTDSDYDDLLPERTTRLIGVEYALLRPEFLELRDASLLRRRQKHSAKRILISLGMTDVGGVTLRAVTALRKAGVEQELDVIITPVAPSLGALQEMTKEDNKLHLHIAPDNVGQLMTQADAALGAMGSTTWERFCLGLPTIGLILADNQATTAKRLEESGLMPSFPNNEDGRFQAITKLKSLMSDPSLLRHQSHLVSEQLDGKGANRVADAILNLIA